MTGTEREKPRHPYAHAARLTSQGPIDTTGLTSIGEGALEIEIGPGRGAFLLDRVEEVPTTRLVGLEIRWKWAAIVDERLSRRGHSDRARVFAADARLILPRLCPDHSVSAFFLHFPDPWWKKRQRKRLVISSPLVQHMVRLLEPSGLLFVQTDVLDRAEAYEALLSAQEALVPAGDERGSARLAQSPWNATSNRERRVVENGIPLVRLLYRHR